MSTLIKIFSAQFILNLFFLFLISNYSYAQEIQNFTTTYDLRDGQSIITDKLYIDIAGGLEKGRLGYIFKNSANSKEDLELSVVQFKIDNIEAKSEILAVGPNQKLIIIGDPELPLTKDVHTFEAQYKANLISNQTDVSIASNIMEKSVNGTSWSIRTKSITATAILPTKLLSNKNQIKHHAYTLLAGKKDLTSTQSSIVTENNQLVVKYHCLKSLLPGEEFYIYLEYPNISSQSSEGNGITADTSETVLINGKSVKVGKSISIEAQASQGQEVKENANEKTITVDGKEIKVGKAIKLNQEPQAEPGIPKAPSDKIKIGGKEFKLGNTIQLNEQKEATGASEATTAPSGKKVEVGKSIRIEE